MPRGRPRTLPPLAAILVALGCGASEAPPAGPADGSASAPSATPPAAAQSAAGHAPGFVVWESNRSGDWRIWTSDLAGGQARQLTPDERRRRHCCAQIAPDGSRVAYVSLPEGRARYLDQEALGELRLIAPDGTGERALADSARTYFEHRAVVWAGTEALHYINADGAVERLEIASGRRAQVLAPLALTRRWLVNATGQWAATGRGAFAPVRGGQLGTESPVPGCQPYFSQDGRWAFWTAGSGGPIDRLDLASSESSTMLRKNDPRLPAGRGYLYFPMLSPDATLFAAAASTGEHDHFAADYDIVVAEIEPATLEILGRFWTVAPHPAVDRFPDLWRAPLELGRTVGAAPLEVELASPDGETWEWSSGERTTTGNLLRQTFRDPGSYPVSARSGERLTHGVVVVEAPAAVPELRDRWPARTDGLLWSWSAAGGEASQLLQDGQPVRPGQALDLRAGFVVALDSAALLHSGLQGTNQLGLDLLLTPPQPQGDKLAAIVAVGNDAARENFTLGQRGRRLVLRMRVGSKGAGAFDEVDLGPLVPGQREHLAIAYSPGRTTVFRGGRQVLTTRDLQGYFFHWRPYPLTLGDRALRDAPWAGRIEALAIYDRPLTPEEAAANAGLTR